MKIYLVIFIVSIFTMGCTPREENPNAYSIDIIDQNQSPYENGVKHGTQIKESIHYQLESWEQGIFNHLKIGRDSMQRIVYEHTGFLDAIKVYTPELLEEIYGIADGAEIDRDLLLYYNLGEEIFNFCKSQIESCSNISYAGKSHNILSYNQDLPNFLHGVKRPVILKHANYFVFSMPGNIALSGVSERIALSCNSLPMLQMNPSGLPLPFYIRKLLQLNDIDEVNNFINNTPLAIGQNLMLISGKEVNNIEISSKQVKWVTIPQGDYYYHTNFPLENTDYYSLDYTAPPCPRFQFLDSIKTQLEIIPSNLVTGKFRDVCSQYPISNDETFLRFIAVFKGSHKPEIEFINPQTKEVLMLKL